MLATIYLTTIASSVGLRRLTGGGLFCLVHCMLRYLAFVVFSFPWWWLAADHAASRWVAPFFVPGHLCSATGAPGRVHQPSVIWSCRMCVTSPGLCPVSNNTCSAIPGTPASLNACQNSDTSVSLSTRSRLTVALRSTPRHGLLVSNSCFVAHVKIADADAST